MQKKTKILAAAGAVALLAIGGVAGLAQADMQNGGMGGGMHRMWGKGHGHGPGQMGQGMMGPAMLERYDANKDGKITQDEINQNRQQWLAEFDTDKNGTLSLDEYKALWLKENNERMVRDFQFLDRDGNGQVTLEEYQRPLARIVADRDRNGDGSLGADDRRMMLRHAGRHGQGMDEGQQPPEAPPPQPN